MEKLKPTIRPRSVRHAASTVRKSSRACGPSDAYLPSSLAPIQAHAHKAMKVSTSMRNGESVRPLIANILVSPAIASRAHRTLTQVVHRLVHRTLEAVLPGRNQ